MTPQPIPIPRSSDPAPADAPLFDLWAMVRHIWAGRWLIAGAMAAFAIIAAGYGLLTPIEFEAATTIAVNTTRADQTTGAADSYARIVQSRALIDRAIEEFKLAAREPAITAGVFSTRVLTVRTVTQTSLVRLVIRLDDPALAATIANRLSTLGIEEIRRLTQQDITASEQDLQSALDEAERRLAAAEQAYTAFATTAQLEVVRSDVDRLLADRDRFRTVVLELEAERGRLARAEQELAARSRTNVTVQSIDSSPALLEAARQAAPDKSPLGLRVTEEQPSQVYTSLDTLIASTRAQVSALERERAELITAAGVAAPRLRRLADLYERQAQLDRLALDRSLARKAYEDVAAKFQSTRLAAIERTPRYQVVDVAKTADQPLSRYLARNVFLGLVAGALFTALFIIARQTVSGSRTA